MDRKLLCQSMLISVKKCLESEDFLNEFREPNRFVRRRILSMKDVINFLIFHPKKTLDTSWTTPLLLFDFQGAKNHKLISGMILVMCKVDTK